MSRISEAFKQVLGTYIDEVNIEELANGAIEGLTKATGDPYTRYVSQKRNMMKC